MREAVRPWTYLLVFLFLLVGGAARSEVLQGRVVGVSDGDTVTVLDEEKTTHKIRLTGIDAPERRQPFSQRSKEHLSVLVFGKDVDVVWSKRDRWNRILGKVMVASPRCGEACCPKTIDAGLEQVAGGLAWWYRNYAREQLPEDRDLYEAAELQARSSRLGLWVEPHPIPPWKWRSDRRKSKRR